jgi:hypothetical protein
MFLFFFFFAVPGLELRAYTLSHSTSPFFVIGVFKIGSRELFALAGFELRYLLISAESEKSRYRKTFGENH